MAVSSSLGGLEEERERIWQGDWDFVVMADVQLGLLNHKFPDSGSSWEEEKELALRCVRECNRLRPKFVVVCGDLVDAMPVTGQKQADGRCEGSGALHDKQVSDFKAIFSQLDESIPLVCVCGNHDVGNLPNRRTIEAWNRNFGKDYFGFWCGGCRCICLNSQLFNAMEEGRWAEGGAHSHLSAEEREESQALARAQDRWLQAEVEALAQLQTPAAHVMAFGHIPPFIRRADEPKGYYNLEPRVRRELLDKLKSARCSKFFCGHYHSNAGGWDGDEGDADAARLEVVVTGAAGTFIPLKVPLDDDAALSPAGQDFSKMQCNPEVSGMRIVRVTKESILHSWHLARTFGCASKAAAEQ
jgi:3',5'-cyclic AMP phosphodiesterase CpdA